MQDLNSLIADILVDWTNELIQDMRKDLDPQVAAGSRSQLHALIVPEYIVSNGRVVMNLSMADYYKYVDQGVSGILVPRSGAAGAFKTKMPSRAHVKSIEEWITAAGIPLRAGKGDSLKRRRSAAFAMGVVIKRKGLVAKPFFKKNITEARIADLRGKIAEKIGRDIELRLLF